MTSPKTVQCKFQCNLITRKMGIQWDYDANQNIQVPVFEIDLYPVVAVSDRDHPNSKFYASTPAGHLKISTINEEAADMFVQGEEYTIDITHCPKVEG